MRTLFNILPIEYLDSIHLEKSGRFLIAFEVTKVAWLIHCTNEPAKLSNVLRTSIFTLDEPLIQDNLIHVDQ